MSISTIILTLAFTVSATPIPQGPTGEKVIVASPISPGNHSGETANAAQLAARRFSQEPTVQDVMREGAKSGHLTEANIQALNRAARLRAILPTASAQYGYGVHRTAGSLRDGTLGMDSISNEDYGGWGIIIGGSWDLPSLVFNPAQLQTYSIQGMRNNILKEISKTYFARRQAILQLVAMPESDELGRLTVLQRIEEYQAVLDGLTNNYFSSELTRRGIEPLR